MRSAQSCSESMRRVTGPARRGGPRGERRSAHRCRSAERRPPSLRRWSAVAARPRIAADVRPQEAPAARPVHDLLAVVGQLAPYESRTDSNPHLAPVERAPLHRRQALRGVEVKRPGSATTMSASAPTSRDPFRSRRQKWRAGPSHSIFTPMVGRDPALLAPGPECGQESLEAGTTGGIFEDIGIGLALEPPRHVVRGHNVQWPAAMCDTEAPPPTADHRRVVLEFGAEALHVGFAVQHQITARRSQCWSCGRRPCSFRRARNPATRTREPRVPRPVSAAQLEKPARWRGARSAECAPARTHPSPSPRPR